MCIKILADITHNGKKQCFLPNFGRKVTYIITLTTLIEHSTGSSSHFNKSKRKREIKDIQMGKGRYKTIFKENQTISPCR